MFGHERGNNQLEAYYSGPGAAVFGIAQGAAMKFGHDRTDSAHLLIGISFIPKENKGTSRAAEILQAQGVGLEQVETLVSRLRCFPKLNPGQYSLPQTSDTLAIYKDAQSITINSRGGNVFQPHVLLALMEQGIRAYYEDSPRRTSAMWVLEVLKADIPGIYEDAYFEVYRQPAPKVQTSPEGLPTPDFITVDARDVGKAALIPDPLLRDSYPPNYLLPLLNSN